MNPIVAGILVLSVSALTLVPSSGRAASFDGRWIADIPAQGKCNYAGTATLMVAGHDFTGQVINGGNTHGTLKERIEDNGDATFSANGGVNNGTGHFAPDHFDISWNNGQCERHAQGVRAPTDDQNSAQAAERAQHQAAYADLVKRAEGGDRTVDYSTLRAEAVYAKDWDFYDTRAGALISQAQAAAKGKDCRSALEKLDQIIRIDFTIDFVHAIRSDCLKVTGDRDRARTESAVAEGLMHSLMNSGDGAKEESAYVVSSLVEDMDVLAYPA